MCTGTPRETELDVGMGQLLESVENRVATLTMNRPDALNALTEEMIDSLLEAVPRLGKDPGVGCLVLRGAGRAFCAGGDVKSMAAANSDEALEQRVSSLRARMEISRYLHELPKPTIASIRGPAAGAGLSMALACDMRIAAEDAKMITAFARVGLSGDFGGSWFLTQLVGTARARELYYLSEPIEVDVAERFGIVNRVVNTPDLERETQVLAERIASGSSITLHYMKRNLNAAESQPLSDCLDLEAFGHSRTGMTEDHREAAQAFVDKRAPSFRGR